MPEGRSLGSNGGEPWHAPTRPPWNPERRSLAPYDERRLTSMELNAQQEMKHLQGVRGSLENQRASDGGGGGDKAGGGGTPLGSPFAQQVEQQHRDGQQQKGPGEGQMQHRAPSGSVVIDVQSAASVKGQASGVVGVQVGRVSLLYCGSFAAT